MVDFRINEILQTGAVENRTYRGAKAVENRTYRGAKAVMKPHLPRYIGIEADRPR